MCDSTSDVSTENASKLLSILGNSSVEDTGSSTRQGILHNIEMCNAVSSSVHCRIVQFLAQYGHKCGEQDLEKLSGYMDELYEKSQKIILETFEIEENIKTSEQIQ